MCVFACMLCCMMDWKEYAPLLLSDVCVLRRADLEQAMAKGMQTIGMSAEAPSIEAVELGATDRERRLLQRIAALEQQLAQKK